MRFAWRARPAGAVIIVVLLVLTVLAIVMATSVRLSSGSLQEISGTEKRERAYRAAEAGAKLALQELRKDAAWTSFDPAVQAMPGQDANFEVKVFTSSGPDAPSNGVVVPPGLLYLESTGRTQAGERSQVGLMVRANGGVLDFAAVVRDKVVLKNGAVVEARDPATDLTLTSAATVVTNSILPGSITLSDNARIEGMARPGAGAAGSAVVLTNGAQATLGYPPLESPIPLDPVLLPNEPDDSKDVLVNENGVDVGGSLQNGNKPLDPGVYGSLKIVNGATLRMKEGQYVFGDIEVDAGQIRVLAGKAVELYAAGKVVVKNGAFVNENKSPGTMKFHVRSDKVELDISASGAAYYVLNAPNSQVVLKNQSKQYGNLIARELEIDGSYLYYDPSVGGSVSNSGSTLPIVKSYQRFDGR